MRRLLRKDGIRMRVDKIANNKVRIFISYEDLAARGIDREELWQNGKKVQELFFDMMEVAYTEVGFEIVGPIAVEAFTMPTEGVVVIVTQVPALPVQGSGSAQDSRSDEEEERDPFGAFAFAFGDFEEVVRAARSLSGFDRLFCSLYLYKNRYHLFFEDDAVDEHVYDSVWAVLHEYGELANVTRAVLDEYGRLLSDRCALQMIQQHFPA